MKWRLKREIHLRPDSLNELPRPGHCTFTETSTYGLWHAEEAGQLLFWMGSPLMVTKWTFQSTKVHFSQYHTLPHTAIFSLSIRIHFDFFDVYRSGIAGNPCQNMKGCIFMCLWMQLRLSSLTMQEIGSQVYIKIILSLIIYPFSYCKILLVETMTVAGTFCQLVM